MELVHASLEAELGLLVSAKGSGGGEIDSEP